MLCLYSPCDVGRVSPSERKRIKTEVKLLRDIEHKNVIKENFPLSKLFSVSNAGHWVHVEQPIKFLEIVTKFLKSD